MRFYSSLFLGLIGTLIIIAGAGCVAGGSTELDSSADSFSQTPADSIATPLAVETTRRGVSTDESIESAPLPTSVATEAAPLPIDVQMSATSYRFSPNVINAKAGDVINLTFSSDSSAHHTFVIDELNIKADTTPGSTLQITAPTKPGTYYFYCDVGSHRALGMEGTLVVE